MDNDGMLLMISIDFIPTMKNIILHPNTPAYIQAIFVIVAFFIGRSYLEKRREGRKFDLVIKANKYCIQASDILMILKQPSIFFENRDAVEKYESINEKNFINLVSDLTKNLLEILKNNQEIFDNLYNCYSEMELFFDEEKEIIKPIEDLLWSRNRIQVLLEALSNIKIKNLTDYAIKKYLKIIRNGMVQIWENIELTDWQEEYQKKYIIRMV